VKLGGPQIISRLREKLQFDVGRHLYCVLGTYGQLKRFEHTDLAQARDNQDCHFPSPINLNRDLLKRIGDDDLRQLVDAEAKRPHAVTYRLNQEFDGLLDDLLQQTNLVILKQLELLFAYNLDLSVLRTRASNQSHVLLLIPAERRGEHVVVFHQAPSRFQRSMPPNLIATNHLWELTN
jgi:hypothetical protein